MANSQKLPGDKDWMMARLSGVRLDGKPTKAAGFNKANPSEAKQVMLQWCQSRVAGYGVKITNFSACWGDSIARFPVVIEFSVSAFSNYLQRFLPFFAFLRFFKAEILLYRLSGTDTLFFPVLRLEQD